MELRQLVKLTSRVGCPHRLQFYNVRSDIVHNRLDRLTPERVHTAFSDGFDIARRSLFKMLREGPPKDWNATGNAGEDGSEEKMW